MSRAVSPTPLRATLGACALLLLSLSTFAACDDVREPTADDLSSFDVQVTGIFASATATSPRVPLPVVTSCILRHTGDGGTPSDANVPAEVRGTRACPYVIPSGDVELEIVITAVDRSGEPLTSFQGPVSFRIVPGELSGDYANRWTSLVNGVGQGTVKAAHLYSEVRVWAEDAPVALILADGGVGGTTSALPEEPKRRTYATGVSPSLFFDEPTVAKVQRPDGFDNRTSPLIGQFLSIGRAPENGLPILQSCDRRPDGGLYPEDGQPAKLVVTGTDPQGFFVTDVTACPQQEVLKDPATGEEVVNVPEPAPYVRSADGGLIPAADGGFVTEPHGYYPGRFGSMFIFNYSFPEGLDQGDVLWAVAGAVQEFTGTTQLVFPSWIIRERAREKPESEWLRHLADIPPAELNLRICGLDDTLEPFVTDSMCGHNRRNLKLESLESGLVKVRQARVPEIFKQCDQNGDSEVPFFCESKGTRPGCDPQQQQSCDEWSWRSCDFENPWDPAAPQYVETACNIDCVTSQGEFLGKRCTERSTFVTFGQFVVELPGPGPAEAGLDPSLPKRIENVALGATTTGTTAEMPAGTQVRIWCDAAARMGAGTADVPPATLTESVPARTLVERTLTGAESALFFVADGAASGTCQVAPNTRTRINLVTKDALPQLDPDCDTDASKVGEAAAKQCQNFRGATYDIVGHLRHLQPGRPRWVILPRDADDVCCHPGPGLECPVPVKPCP